MNAPRPTTWLLLVAGWGAGLASPPALAKTPGPMSYAEASRVPRALTFHVTERGQRYFAENLQDFILRSGFEVTEGGFESWPYRAEEPLVLDRLPLPYQKFAPTLGAVRDIIEKWVRGFTYNDPLFSADVSNIQFNAQYRRLGMRVDRQATARLPRGEGFALLFEAEVAKIELAAESVRGQDEVNTFLDQFGMDHAWLRLDSAAGKSAPLKLQIPVTIALRKDGVDVRITDFRTNLAELVLESGFDRPMLLPKVKVRINGGPAMALNQDRIEEALLAQKPKLLAALQAYIADYAQQFVPGALNKILTEKLTEPFVEVNEMTPPTSDKKLVPKGKFRWAVRPESMSYENSLLSLVMTGFVDDPASKNAKPVSKRLTSRPPNLERLNASTYDLALAINEDLVNRILGLSYERGYFKELEVDHGQPLQMLAAPVFTFDATTDKSHGRLHIKVRQRPVGWGQKLAINGRLDFEMDVLTRLKNNRQTGALSIVLDQIDVASLRIDFGTVTSPFEGMVRKGVIDKLRESNASYKAKETLLVEQLPVPSQIHGVPIKTVEFESDTNGYLVLFFEYDLSH